MPEHKLGIRRAAVLGAGVMGAQIAAHFTAAGIPVYLFDLPSDNADRSKLARQGIQRLLKLKPAPLVDARLAGLIRSEERRVGKEERSGGAGSTREESRR